MLDEATTALGPDMEAEICATLERLSGTVTIVAVSHQAALRRVANQVFEVDGGTVLPVPTVTDGEHLTAPVTPRSTNDDMSDSSVRHLGGPQSSSG